MSAHRNCSACERQLPPAAFATTTGGRVLNTCRACYRDAKRTAQPMKPVARDSQQIRINNADALWFYPARPTNLLRYAA